MTGTAPHRLHPAQPGLDRMSVGSVAAFHVKQQPRLSRQAEPELAARASVCRASVCRSIADRARHRPGGVRPPGRPGERCRVVDAAPTSQHHPAQECRAGPCSPARWPGSSRQALPVRRSRLGAPDSALPTRRSRLGAPGSAARRFDTPRFGSVRFGTARLTDPRSGAPRLGGARLNAPEQLTGADRIGVGRTALARSSRPGVLNPLARQHGHPPIALALAQGLPPGTVGTPARGTPARRTSARWPRQGGPAARRPGGPAARRPGGPAARRPGGPAARMAFRRRTGSRACDRWAAPAGG